MENSETYEMNMLCNNCEGHSTRVFKMGEACKALEPIVDDKGKIKERVTLYLCPHCGCVEARATIRVGGFQK